MKRVVSVAALLCAALLTLAGCASETDSAIDDMESVVNKIVDEAKGKSKEEMKESLVIRQLAEELNGIEKRLNGLQDKITSEQKTRIATILQRAKEQMQ